MTGGRFGMHRPRVWPAWIVQRVAELAGQQLGDRAIAEDVGLTKPQVAGIRSRHRIPAGQPQGRQPKKTSAVIEPYPQPTVPLEVTPWRAKLEAADERTFVDMRRAVCKVLMLSPRVSDESMIAAAQQDRRTAEELENAYLLAYGRQSCDR